MREWGGDQVEVASSWLHVSHVDPLQKGLELLGEEWEGGGWGRRGIPPGSFTDRKWREGGWLVVGEVAIAAFLPQMFDRENIFTAGEGKGREK